MKPTRAVLNQIRWERDVAISQLNDIGVGFGADMSKVKEAIEKQIPKKLKQTKDGKLACECGLVIQVKNKINCLYYCHNCGQKIDWNK